MNNTFWTLIDNNYYRVHNKLLRHAPINIGSNTIELSQASIVKFIEPEQLEKINEVLGCSFIMDDF